MKRILIVDPDSRYRGRAQGALSSLQCDVTVAESVEHAIATMVDAMPDLIIAGCNEPEDKDLQMMRLARQASQPIPVLVLAERGNTRGAIGFMDAGAYDYMAKPGDTGELLSVVRDILRLADGNAAPFDEIVDDPTTQGTIIGNSSEMIEIYKMVGRIAKSDAAVLIQGESGTGKELVARTIHENSRRSDKPFLAVNCAAIPETLLESELFGHEKGAFTGASYSRKGKFELSHGGTIFLDEVGDMSLPTQAKILRVLQEHTFERVGGEETLAADTRIIAATNKSLVDAIDRHEFRVDLFYRLKVVSIFLPPLRKRQGDIRLLVDHFIQKYSHQSAMTLRGITERASALLESNAWTGNVRELENAIQTAVVLTRTGTLDTEDFPFLSSTDPTRGDESAMGRLEKEAASAAVAILALEASGESDVYHRCVETVERALVKAALDACEGNQVQASKRLGISRNTLRSKMSTSSPPRESGE